MLAHEVRIVTRDQLALGYCELVGWNFLGEPEYVRHNYQVIRALPDGTYLVREPEQ
jgi:hypothetical protein